MDKAKLKEFADWLNNCISEYKDEHHPEPKPEPKPKYAQVTGEPRVIPVRACEVCGIACGATYCIECMRDAVTLRLDIEKAQATYLYGEHFDNPDLDGFEHAVKDAKRGYLRRIEKRKEANR